MKIEIMLFYRCVKVKLADELNYKSNHEAIDLESVFQGLQ